MSEKLTSSETAMAKAMVRPNPIRNRPMMPDMNATGTNTAIRDMVVASTAMPMSLVAATAAGNGL